MLAVCGHTAGDLEFPLFSIFGETFNIAKSCLEVGKTDSQTFLLLR